MDLSSIKRVLSGKEGQDLREYLLSNLLVLKSIESIDEKATPTQQALEFKANKKAYKILKDVFDQIMSWSESDVHPLEGINDYGV